MRESPPRIHPTAVIDRPCKIGAGTRIWHFCHVMKGARIGKDCRLGQNVFVGGRAVIGDRVKIQNNVSIYDGLELEDDVFCGPSCVFTNIRHPRAEINRRACCEPTRVRRGATIGANATVTSRITIGRYALIGAGAVVCSDVPDYAVMLGVPARQKGWVGRHGVPLPSPDAAGRRVCPFSGWRYRLMRSGILRCMDWPEKQSLPQVTLKPARRPGRRSA